MITSDPQPGELFESLPIIDEDANARLHARLVATAERDGVLDVGYRTIDTPMGTLLLAATDLGLVRVAFDREDYGAVLTKLAIAVSPRILCAPARLEEASRQIGEYFAGRRKAFELSLDFRLSKGFRRSVLTQLPAIAYGHTRSYAEVAIAAGSPHAVRAVGTACATNPLPIVVPCHRVVRSDGSIGGYVGGPEAKQALLNMEATA